MNAHRLRLIAIAVVLAVLFSACESDGGQSTQDHTTSPSAQPPSPTPTAATTQDVRRTLDFGAKGHEGTRLISIPYGDARADLGFAPRCTDEDCPSPCPCSVSLGPVSFDVDSRGRLWVLDIVKARVAVYGPGGGFLRDLTLGNLGYRSFDVQASNGHSYVLFQDRDLSAGFFILEGAGRRRLSVTFNGDRTESASTFSLQDDTAYLSLFVGDEFADEEIPAALPLKLDARRTEAEEAPGRPFLDGWFLFQEFKNSRVVPLAVTSSQENWSTDIRFRLLHPEGRRVNGAVSWQLVIDDDGDLHLILFAGTFGRDRVDGYWYLKVAADGTVGRPVRLRDPSSNLDQQQNRMLTLGPGGRPQALFLDKPGVVISTLTSLEEKSLPSG